MRQPIALYVHWPFCEVKCPYCDFNSHVTENIDHASWQASLLKELSYYAAETAGRTVASLYFGGGTPSLMRAHTVAAIIDATANMWGFTSNPEITLEANPSSTEIKLFKNYYNAGINRASLGIQSLKNTSLAYLGRRHNADEAKHALNTAATIFDRLSFDMIYGLPKQSPCGWGKELGEALEYTQDHISVYQLTIEPGTAFFKKRTKAVDEILAADLFTLTRELLREANLPAYEVSNHARFGSEGRHNLSCWQGGDYIGIGPGAHGRITHGKKFIATHQIHNPSRWLERVASDGHGTGKRRQLNAHERGVEMVITGLRLARGLDVNYLKKHTGLALSQLLDPVKIQQLIHGGFLIWNEGSLIATEQGIACLNTLIAALLVPEKMVSIN